MSKAPDAAAGPPQKVPQTDAEVDDALREEREKGGIDTSEKRAVALFQFVMRVPQVGGEYHWFCAKVPPLAVEAATFAIRMFAYTESTSLGLIKERLSIVLHGCCECMRLFQNAKRVLRTIYLSGMVSVALMEHIEGWERGIIRERLQATGMPSTSRAKMSLNSLPPPVVYHCVANPNVLADSDLSAMLATYCPSLPISNWPSIPAPGLFLLLAHANPDVRAWAAAQLSVAATPTDDTLNEDHKIAIFALARALLPQHELQQQGKTEVTGTPWKGTFNGGDGVVWPAFLSVLELIPPSVLKHRVVGHNRVYHVVIGHLNDSGEHFEQVLRCFAVLLRKLGPELWTLEGEEYPQVVFASVKDNRAFVGLLESSQDPWFFAWLEPFILSVWDKPTFADIMAKIVSFMCEELQHERFKKWHPLIMSAMAKTLLSVMQKCETADAAHYKAIRTPFDIHAQAFVNVALSSSKSSEGWNAARAATRSLLAHVLFTDIRDIEAKARLLSDVLAGKKVDKDSDESRGPTLSFGQPLWDLTFRVLQGEGVTATGITFIVPIIAHCGLLDTLRPASYPIPKTEVLRAAYKAILDAVNGALSYLQNSFEKVIDDFTSGSTSSKNLDAMLGALVQPVVSLLFSPSSALRNAAQSLVSYVHRNDGGRADCFRSLLEKSPEATLKALTRVNENFAVWASFLSEACNMSQALVRCLSDVLEVLCSREGGLIFENSFIYPPGKTRPTRQITALWGSMCKALSVIFRRTPSWAQYYENRIMTDWMRDALIFGRDLLTYRSTLEGAVIAAESDEQQAGVSTPRKLSSAGKQMVVDLQVVLKEVINWLRLTDHELLYQSLNLLRSLFECFRKTDTKPADEPMQKLARFLDKARQRAEADDGDATTRLSAVDLAALSEDMGSFNDGDDDDDVQIVDPPPGVTFKKRARSPVEVVVARKQPKIQAGSSASSKTSAVETKATKTTTKPAIAPIFKSSTSRSIQQASSSKPSTSSKSSTSSSSSSSSRITAKPPPPPAKPAPVARLPYVPEYPKPFTVGPGDRYRDFGQNKTVAKPAKSSDGSDSSSEEDDNSGLAGLEKVQRSPPKIRKPEERRQVKMLSISGQEVPRQRGVFQDRTNKLDEARRIRERLKPDLTPLHRRILSWDYDRTSDSPWADNAPSLAVVPSVFRDHPEYMRIFEPLLLSECWSQLIKSKEESNIPVLACSISGKGYVDEWVELEIVISEALPPKWFLAETDILLLRHPTETTTKLLAKVHASMISPRGGNRELRATLRCKTDSAAGVVVGTNWQLSRVFSLSTVHREFASLVALPYYDLFEPIIRAQHSPKRHVDSADVRRAMKSHRVNEPQARAIVASMEADGFMLVQGPPGTGKTSTICGMVGAFLSNRPKPATVIQVGRVAAPGKPQIRKKILICAPSNAGIDEVAKRLREGVFDSSGARVVPNIVRVGIDANVNASVKDVTLDFLVDQKLGGPAASSSKDEKVDTNALHVELRATRSALEQKYSEEQALQERGLDVRLVKNEIHALKNKRLALSKRLDDARDKQKADNRAVDAARRKFRAEVLQEADVICSTLAGAGHETLESFEFETVIIDEAAQSIELSSLIPLKYGCKRCIMVGDPQQLPPTVISPMATRHKYNQSFIQYRMHPEISRVPSRLFYEGRLQDGPDMAKKTEKPWHANQVLGPYRFFNVVGGNHESAAAGHSLINHAECNAALSLYELFLRDFRQVDMNYRIGVISMYKAQINLMKRKFEERYGADRASTIDFNTVDGFQGQEKDIIILSCVRAGPGVTSIGFLSDVRRLNVSITRARSSLFILGHAATLHRSDQTWKTIVDDARARSLLVDVERNTFSSTGTMQAVANVPSTSGRPRTATPSLKRQAPAPPPTSDTSGLMTPQVLAQTVAQNAGARPSGLKRSLDDTVQHMQPAEKRRRTSGPSEENKEHTAPDTKLQQPPEQPPAGSSAHGSAPPRPLAPRPPRPKKAPQTMFIPKKKPAPG
ncbi:hypothetical protein EXIGLDRAFT_763074 [Exidia glandulosa HHB12029]|uniref:Helicase ATP-binding domain-containing protein n=1 Tax=Exidia glandulosa HHB12029 TaxID=1314781 RepID=A0A165M6L5_EXIGL|nr:hypothetical protein EXIGLDRAFT_763074 [Exidia glandulosa HHB12029]